jgi:hypothetical protein
MDDTLRYAVLGFAVNKLLDRGDVLDLEDTRDHIDAGSLFDWLKDKFGGDMERSMSIYQDADVAAVLERFRAFVNFPGLDSRFGVEHNGLALVAAYCFAGLQEIHYPRFA